MPRLGLGYTLPNSEQSMSTMGSTNITDNPIASSVVELNVPPKLEGHTPPNPKQSEFTESGDNYTQVLSRRKRKLLNPVPNLNRQRNKRSQDSEANGSIYNNDSEDSSNELFDEDMELESRNGESTYVEELIQEIHRLRAEMKKLLAQVNSQSPENLARSPNRREDEISTSNRYEALREVKDGTQNENKSEEPTSLIEAIKKRNAERKHNRKTALSQTTANNTRSLPKDTTKTHSPTSESQQSTSQMNGPYQPQRQQPSTRGKPPPINIVNQESRDTVNLLQDELKIKDFFIKRISKGKHTVYLCNTEDHKKVREALNEISTEYYTYTPKSEKQQLFLLKGLDSDCNERDILQELLNLNIQNINFTNVSRFQTKFSIKNEKPHSIFLVQLSPDSKAAALNTIRYLNRHVIYWEKLEKKESIQCHNCQRIGHAASNCKLDYRCVKCDGKHKPRECTLSTPAGTKNEPGKLYCVLCRQFGHPASYRACPKQIEIRQRMLDRDRPTRIDKTSTPIVNSFTRPNLQYSQAVRDSRRPANVGAQVPIARHPQESPSGPYQEINIMQMFEQFKNSLLQTISVQYQETRNEIKKIAEKTDFLYKDRFPSV